MAVLNIHHEGLRKENFPNGDSAYYFRKILEKDIPIVISPCLNNYKRGDWNSTSGMEALELIKEIVKKDNSALGQQGFTHSCIYRHILADKWHEFYCLWNRRIPKDYQKEWMKKGREELEDLIGITPEVFVPPNHYFDDNTLEAADELGYSYFTDQAVIPLQPYKFNNMFVVPEGNLTRKDINNRMGVYIHTDQIHGNIEFYNKAIGNATSIYEIKTKKVENRRISINRRLKYSRKVLRDFVKAPKRIWNIIKG